MLSKLLIQLYNPSFFTVYRRSTTQVKLHWSCNTHAHTHTHTHTHTYREREGGMYFPWNSNALRDAQALTVKTFPKTSP